MVVYSFIDHHLLQSGPGRPNPPPFLETTIPSFSGGSAFPAQSIRRSDRWIAAAVDSSNRLRISTDGTRTVSGSQDDIVLFGDAFNGELITGPFEGHSLVDHSVAFRQVRSAGYPCLPSDLAPSLNPPCTNDCALPLPPITPTTPYQIF